MKKEIKTEKGLDVMHTAQNPNHSLLTHLILTPTYNIIMMLSFFNIFNPSPDHKYIKTFKISRPDITSSVSSVKNSQNFRGEAQTEMDSHADMCCVGGNFIPIAYTGETCSVSPYSDTYKPINNVKICSALTAIDHQESGQTVICEINQALDLGHKLHNSLLNPNQLRAFGIDVNDNPFSKRSFFGIEDHQTGIKIPFNIKNGIVGFKSRPPSRIEIENCQHIVLTGDSPWDPSNIDVLVNNKDRKSIHQVKVNQNIHVEPCISNISSIYQDETLKTALLSNSNARRLKWDISSTSAMRNKRHHNPEPQAISSKWNICLNKATEILQKTTQNALRSATGLLTRRYCPDLNFVIVV